MSDLVYLGVIICLIAFGTMGCSTLNQVDLEEILNQRGMSAADISSFLRETRGALTAKELLRRECRKMDGCFPEGL